MDVGDIVKILSPPLDEGICKKLIGYYIDARKDQLLCRWSDAITKYGKFLELMPRMIYEYASTDKTEYPFGRYIEEIKKIKTLPNNLRLITNSIILSGYSIRSDRDAAHPSTKIDPNELDCNYIAAACDWILCELLVEFGDKSRKEADEVINSIITRKIPLVYEASDGNLILLENGYAVWLKVAILLYITKKQMTTEEISKCIRADKETIRKALFNRKDVFYKLSDGRYELLPPGMIAVDEVLSSKKPAK